jgi:hypothetical protein
MCEGTRVFSISRSGTNPHAMSAESPPRGLDKEVAELERLKRKSLEIATKIKYQIDSVYRYRQVEIRRRGFAWADELRIERSLAEMEKILRESRDRFARKIEEQECVLATKRATLVMFAMLGLPKNQNSEWFFVSEFMDIILRFARE